MENDLKMSEKWTKNALSYQNSVLQNYGATALNDCSMVLDK